MPFLHAEFCPLTYSVDGKSPMLTPESDYYIMNLIGQGPELFKSFWKEHKMEYTFEQLVQKAPVVCDLSAQNEVA